jgi:hypothetical protein
MTRGNKRGPSYDDLTPADFIEINEDVLPRWAQRAYGWNPDGSFSTSSVLLLSSIMVDNAKGERGSNFAGTSSDRRKVDWNATEECPVPHQYSCNSF